MTTEEKFLAAVEIINSLPRDGAFQPSEDLIMKLYSYQRQATEGPCNVPKPSIWDMTSRTKWNAWNDLGNMPKEIAMEKYIEELTNVIETMSYNEKVSKFMSLIGPFYEVVTSEEIDSQAECKMSNGKYAECSFPETIFENFDDLRNVEEATCTTSCEITRHNKIFIEKNVPKSDSTSTLVYTTEKAELNTLSVFSGNKHTANSEKEKHMVDIFKTKKGPRNPPFLPRDLLVLTVINLQNSLEDVVKTLDKLKVLAKAPIAENSEVKNKNLKSDEWSLNLPGTAFALLWPVAVHFYMGSF